MKEKNRHTMNEDCFSGRAAEENRKPVADSHDCEPIEEEHCPLSEDPELRRLQNAFGETLGDLPLPEETQQEWTAFIERQEQKKRILIRRIRWSCSTAAAIVLLVLLWSPWKGTESDLSNIEVFAALNAPETITTTEKNGMITITTPPATITRLTLEDGTRVLVSANSRLEYPKEFTSHQPRSVHLSGEARFEVTQDAHRPFIVSAQKMQTQVLGTVFDVNAYPDTPPTITLYKGHVRVSKAKSKLEKDLLPGQCATLTPKGDLHLSETTLTENEGWTQEEFFYDNTEMLTVLQNIGTWYNISIICRSADLLHKRVHFRFSRNAPIESLLTVLNDLEIAHFEYKDRQIVVE